jgi:LuxR family maltose regulon positive regulatory protein
MPLYYQGALAPVQRWLESLSNTELDDRPGMWVVLAMVSTMTGQPLDQIEQHLTAAETALGENLAENLVGQIAAIRALNAVPRNDLETIQSAALQALESLNSDSLPERTAASWALGYTYQVQGEREKAAQLFSEAASMSRESNNLLIEIGALTSLGQIQESQNFLEEAERSYLRVIDLAGEPPLPTACEAHLGIARLNYQWNDLAAAIQHAQASSQLAGQLKTVDTPIGCAMILARVDLARGNADSAERRLVEADRFLRRNSLTFRKPDLAEIEVLTLLGQDNLPAARKIAEEYDLPKSEARVYLALGDPGKALDVLNPYSRMVAQKGWNDQLLQTRILQSLALNAQNNTENALRFLEEALELAEPGGIIRAFIDQGSGLAELLSSIAEQGSKPWYISQILAACEDDVQESEQGGLSVPAQGLIEPLTQRELEVLQLVAEGLSNREIGEQLYLAVNTIKGHNRSIFNKLGVKRRTEAVARARELEILSPGR